jgi:hypothetical protein
MLLQSPKECLYRANAERCAFESVMVNNYT